MEVKIKLMDGGIMPQMATDCAAAFDLFCPKTVIVKKGRQVIPMGFKLEMPEGIKANVRSRSGFTLKGFEGKSFVVDAESNMVVNCQYERFDADVVLGLIDADYRGEVGVLLVSHSDTPFVVTKGSRIAQLEFGFVPQVHLAEYVDLSETRRGEGGFGSTGV